MCFSSSHEAEGAEQKDEDADGDKEEEEDGEDEDGADGDDDVGGAPAGDGQESGEDDDYDMDVMRQLLEGFHSQQLSPEDRESLMSAAGELKLLRMEAFEQLTHDIHIIVVILARLLAVASRGTAGVEQ